MLDKIALVDEHFDGMLTSQVAHFPKGFLARRAGLEDEK